MDLLAFAKARHPNREIERVEMIPGSRAYRIYFKGGGVGFGGLPSMEEDTGSALQQYMEDIRGSEPISKLESERLAEDADPYFKYRKQLGDM